MTELFQLNLIRLFTFYLAAMFLISTVRRIGQYNVIAQLVIRFLRRWPNTFKKIQQHHTIFLTWDTFRPAAVAISLLIIQMICSRVIWPTAHLTLDNLTDEWWMFPFLLITGGAMFAVDIYFVVRVAEINQEETEKSLDQAEHWLTSWKAPFVKVLTLGYLDPKQQVNTEVKKSLEYAKDLLGQTLWWVSLQTGCRILFGLVLWISWALYPGLPITPETQDGPQAPLEEVTPATSS